MTTRFALFLSRIPTPHRHGRIMALLLASLGGAVDVFSHIHYKALVATQTGNFILLIADMSHSSQHAIHLRWLSVIFFSLGYLGGHLLHDLLGQRGTPETLAYFYSGALPPRLFCDSSDSPGERARGPGGGVSVHYWSAHSCTCRHPYW